MFKLYQSLSNTAIEWANSNQRSCWDFGGRFNCPRGFSSVDLKDADLCWDLRGHYPFSYNSVGVIRAHDFLEHIADKMHSLREIHRALAPGGYLLSMTPSTDGRGAWQDPTHVSFWNENSFWYVTRPEIMKYIDNTTVKFEPLLLKTDFPTFWHEQNNIPYVLAVLRKI